jgi:serine protease Do
MKQIFQSMIIAVVSAVATFFLMQNHQLVQSVDPQPAASTVLVKDYVAPEVPKNLAFPSDFINTSKRVTNAVVNITTYTDSGYPRANGSGVVYSGDGYIITNNHVVEGSDWMEVTLSDKRKYRAKKIGSDRTTDLALLKIDVNGLTPITIGNSDQVQVGEWVLAVGNPFNLTSTVTAGIVSAKGRNLNIIEETYSIESFIQTDAVVNPGNSGGALVNTHGELVGINTAILSETGGYEGYSFAIPSNLVKKVVRDFKDYGEVRRAVLGVVIGEVDGNLARRLDLPFVGGVYISEVNPNSSASAAGLRNGDIIVGVNNRKISTVPELQEQVAQYRPGDSIDLRYYRNGRTYDLKGVKLKGISSAVSYRR